MFWLHMCWGCGRVWVTSGPRASALHSKDYWVVWVGARAGGLRLAQSSVPGKVVLRRERHQAGEGRASGTTAPSPGALLE